ncbi:hypothetical protein [Dysgonomonas sp. ZJ709]|uniref:hypothetical protein n=1 Tax=Dysgonomonas sp. ZJ709 TaxID=2709797 RepID=UPI0013EDA1DD|nr:hypothetical protein [Dysgonomonas sp. ZJ709]
MKNNIKIGYLISYDYKYMKYSLPTVYSSVDYIVLAIDKERITWNGESFEIEDSFFHWVEFFDTEKKIHFYEDVFYLSNLTSMECETRERNMLAQFMGEGGWHIQMDVDEYFLDFAGFVESLKSLDTNIPTTIYAKWITIFKQSDSDMFLINSNETFPLATNTPSYKMARNTGRLERNLSTDFKVLHQSWGRSEEELMLKLRNWGHNIDFEINAYFNLWKAINRHTYKYIKDFHPTNPTLWKALEHVEARDIPMLIKIFQE